VTTVQNVEDSIMIIYVMIYTHEDIRL